MQKQLLTNGNAFKRTDGRWGGVVWYKDEQGERKRKSFSGTTKAEVNKKMTDYISKFEEEIIEAIEGNKTVSDSLLNYLQVFKYPNVERVTYDRNEQIYKNQIVPYMGKLIVSNITGADIKRLISTLTDKGYSFSTVKQTYNLLNEYFDYLRSLNITHSFSRAYVPYDNSVMESFFSSFKREELYRTKYRSEADFYKAVDNYIDFYNTKRPHKKLHYKTPQQKEEEYTLKNAELQDTH